MQHPIIEFQIHLELRVIYRNISEYKIDYEIDVNELNLKESSVVRLRINV